MKNENLKIIFLSVFAVLGFIIAFSLVQVLDNYVDYKTTYAKEEPKEENKENDKFEWLFESVDGDFKAKIPSIEEKRSVEKIKSNIMIFYNQTLDLDVQNFEGFKRNATSVYDDSFDDDDLKDIYDFFNVDSDYEEIEILSYFVMEDDLYIKLNRQYKDKNDDGVLENSGADEFVVKIDKYNDKRSLTSSIVSEISVLNSDLSILDFPPVYN